MPTPLRPSVKSTDRLIRSAFGGQDNAVLVNPSTASFYAVYLHRRGGVSFHPREVGPRQTLLFEPLAVLLLTFTDLHGTQRRNLPLLSRNQAKNCQFHSRGAPSACQPNQRVLRGRDRVRLVPTVLATMFRSRGGGGRVGCRRTGPPRVCSSTSSVYSGRTRHAPAGCHSSR